MKELERRDFAKQTLKWGGALTLLTVLNPARVALGAGPGSGNPRTSRNPDNLRTRDIRRISGISNERR